MVATDEVVALKQIKFDQALTHEGFPIAAMREIGVLLALSHESIVTVREMVVGDAYDKVFMVMEVSPTYSVFPFVSHLDILIILYSYWYVLFPRD